MALDFRTASWKELKREYKRLASEMGDDQFFTKKELRYLPEALMPGEQIEAFSSGMMNGNTWLIALTDRRIIMLDKGMVFGLKQQSIDLDRISAVSCKTGLVFGSIIITDNANDKAITNVLKQSVQPFTNKIQATIDRRKNMQRQAEPIHERQNEGTESLSQSTCHEKEQPKGWWGKTKRAYGRAVWILLAATLIVAAINGNTKLEAVNTTSAVQTNTDLHTPFTSEPAPQQEAVQSTTTIQTERQNPAYISDDTYSGTWPFTVSSGMISCVKPGAVLFKADNGKTYAVNGNGMAYFKQLPDLEEIWKADPKYPSLKIGIGDMIDYGLSLCDK